MDAEVSACHASGPLAVLAGGATRHPQRQAPVDQRDAPQGRPEMPSIFQISPVRVTTYAVFPMNSSEVGRSRPSVMTVKVPSRLTLTSAPVFGCAGVPSSVLGSPDQSPCERAYRRRRGPNSTSTRSGAPEATSVAAGDFGLNDTTLPSSGRWGTGPASAMYTVLPDTASPVGTMLSKAINSVTSPSRVTRSTRL